MARINLGTGTPAELVVPEGAVTRGLVMVPDIMGLRPLFDDLCARVATDHGYAVCAIEPFPGRESTTLDERRAAMAGLDDEQFTADLVAAKKAVGVEPVAVMGFCMGGMYALKASASGIFDRAVAFYGMIRLPEAWRGAAQAEPLELLQRPSPTSVLAIIGELDPYTPADDVAALEATGATVARYPDAEHGFAHDPDRPAHRPDDAADAWQRVYAFLD